MSFVFLKQAVSTLYDLNQQWGCTVPVMNSCIADSLRPSNRVFWTVLRDLRSDYISLISGWEAPTLAVAGARWWRAGRGCWTWPPMAATRGTRGSPSPAPPPRAPATSPRTLRRGHRWPRRSPSPDPRSPRTASPRPAPTTTPPPAPCRPSPRYPSSQAAPWPQVDIWRVKAHHKAPDTQVCPASVPPTPSRRCRIELETNLREVLHSWRHSNANQTMWPFYGLCFLDTKYKNAFEPILLTVC